MKARRLFLFVLFLSSITVLGAADEDPECKIENKREGSGTSFLIANPENDYQASLNQLLAQEVENLKAAVANVERKRMQLVKIQGTEQPIQVIELENSTGVWRNSQKVNYQAVLHLSYKNERLHCLILESTTRPIYEPEKWTHKIVRLRFPGIESLELASHRHNLNMLQNLENVDPGHQLELLRLIVRNLQTALYTMDMKIAAYYNLRNKKNEWQINM